VIATNNINGKKSITKKNVKIGIIYPEPLKPIIEFKTTSNLLNEDETFTIIWEVKNANKVTVDGVSNPLKGSITVKANPQKTSFTLVAINEEYGKKKEERSVIHLVIAKKPIIKSLDLPTFALANVPLTLKWSAENYESVDIYQNEILLVSDRKGGNYTVPKSKVNSNTELLSFKIVAKYNKMKAEKENRLRIRKNATIGQRIGAYFFDSFFYSMFIVLCLSIAFMLSDNGFDKSQTIIVFLGLVLLVTYLYFPFAEALSGAQGTWGARLFKIQVTDVNGDKINQGKAIARFLSKIFSTVLLMTGFLPIWSEKNQALHELISGTLLLKK